MAAQKSNTKFVTGEVRLSYAQQLYTPKSNDRGDMKFGVTLLIAKTDTITIERMRAAGEAIKRTKQPGKDEAYYKAMPRTIHDGDGVKPSTGESYGPECKGHWVVAVSSNERPDIVDRSGAPVIEKLNSGDYAYVSLNCFWFDTGTNRGPTFGLNNLMFARRGDRIDGRSSAAEDFADLLEF